MESSCTFFCACNVRAGSGCVIGHRSSIHVLGPVLYLLCGCRICVVPLGLFVAFRDYLGRIYSSDPEVRVAFVSWHGSLQSQHDQQSQWDVMFCLPSFYLCLGSHLGCHVFLGVCCMWFVMFLGHPCVLFVMSCYVVARCGLWPRIFPLLLVPRILHWLFFILPWLCWMDKDGMGHAKWPVVEMCPVTSRLRNAKCPVMDMSWPNNIACSQCCYPMLLWYLVLV